MIQIKFPIPEKELQIGIFNVHIKEDNELTSICVDVNLENGDTQTLVDINHYKYEEKVVVIPHDKST